MDDPVSVGELAAGVTASAASLSRPESTPTSTRGVCPLLIRPEASRQACPHLHRTREAVPLPLRKVIGDLSEGRARWPLYLHGPPGGGKTSAVLAMLDHCGPVLPPGLVATPPALDWLAGYVPARSLSGVRIDADKGRLTWRTPGSGSDELSWHWLAAALLRAPLVVIDDLAVGVVRDHGLQVLLEVIDPRCGNPVRPLVVVSNLAPTRLAEATDDRAADRLLAGTVFELNVPSRRTT